jgi:hypothetical protein
VNQTGVGVDNQTIPTRINSRFTPGFDRRKCWRTFAVTPAKTRAKTRRGSATGFAVSAIIVLVLGMAVAAATYAAARFMPALHDVASVARIPIPGTADAVLARREYGLYFGLLNAPTGKAIHVPKLRITIVPPDGIGDPDFVEVPPEIDVCVDGFHTVQVARISVLAPGKYHLHESPEEFGGSFSVGELPATLDADRSLARALPVGVGALILSALLAIAAGIVRLVERRAEQSV